MELKIELRAGQAAAWKGGGWGRMLLPGAEELWLALVLGGAGLGGRRLSLPRDAGIS